MPALFERFRSNRRTRRDKLEAIMRKTAEAAAVKGDVPKAPDVIVAVSQVRRVTQETAVEHAHPEILTGPPDARPRPGGRPRAWRTVAASTAAWVRLARGEP